MLLVINFLIENVFFFMIKNRIDFIQNWNFNKIWRPFDSFRCCCFFFWISFIYYVWFFFVAFTICLCVCVCVLKIKKKYRIKNNLKMWYKLWQSFKSQITMKHTDISLALNRISQRITWAIDCKKKKINFIYTLINYLFNQGYGYEKQNSI